MSFHSPIDEVQWNRAKFSYARMRSNIKSLDKERPPQTPDESSILRSYKVYVRAFGLELVKPLKTIDADQLNDLENRAVSAFVVYLGIRKRRK